MPYFLRKSNPEAFVFELILNNAIIASRKYVEYFISLLFLLFLIENYRIEFVVIYRDERVFVMFVGSKVKKSLLLLSACTVALGTAFIVVSPVSAQVVQHDSLSISLKDAVATGVKTNPEYGIVAASRRATDEELNQGRSLYLPSLDFAADAGYEYTDDSNTRGGADNDDEESLFRTQSSLTLTQLLFDGWSTHYEVQRQKARVTSAAHRVDETAELVGLSVVEAYLNVLRQRYLLGISDQNVQDHVDILKQIQDGVGGGRSTQADLEQANARLAQARATQASVLESLQNAESEYRREVGDDPGALMLPVVPYEALKPTVDDEVMYVLANSPTLKIRESDIEVTYAEAEGTQSTYYPQVDLQLQSVYGDDVNGIETYDKNASALVVMNWNLYRGGGDVAREREFKHRHQQSKEERAQTARNLEDEVRQTWSGMVSAGTRAKQFSDQATANLEVVKAYRDQFDLDRRTLLDVLDAQNELFVSQTSKVNAEFAQMFSVYRLLGLKGELFSTLGIEGVPEINVASKNTLTDDQKKLAR